MMIILSQIHSFFSFSHSCLEDRRPARKHIHFRCSSFIFFNTQTHGHILQNILWLLRIVSFSAAEIKRFFGDFFWNWLSCGTENWLHYQSNSQIPFDLPLNRSRFVGFWHRKRARNFVETKAKTVTNDIFGWSTGGFGESICENSISWRVRWSLEHLWCS